MYDSLRAADTEVLAIGGSDTATAARIAETFVTPFPILADPDRAAYRSYGFGKFAMVVQRSGTVLVDRGGIVRYLNRTTNPKNSLQKEQLLEAIAAL